MKRTATAAEKRHLEAVAQMGCIVCEMNGYPNTPAEVHHVRARHGWGRTSHYATVPFCAFHHRLGPDAVHNLGRLEFAQAHGLSEIAMMILIQKRLGVPQDYIASEDV